MIFKIDMITITYRHTILLVQHAKDSGMLMM